MKTIYTTAGKFTINDELTQLADRAVQRVYDLMMEEDWRQSIEINVANSTYGTNAKRQAKLKIFQDSGEDDALVTRVERNFAGQNQRGLVKVDLGKFGVEIWESLIDHKDLRSLPNVYFSPMFVYYIVDGDLSIIPLLSEVENRHLPQLARKIHREAQAAYQQREMIKEFADRYQRLTQSSYDFCTRKITLDDFLKIIKIKD